MTADVQRLAMYNLAVGIDVGTSGVRAAAVDETELRVAFAAVKMPLPLNRSGLVTLDPAIWWDATRRVFRRLSRQIELKEIGAIAVTGTSGTILGVDANGRPVTPAQMYNSQASAKVLRRIAAVAPPETGARGPTSALARAIALQQEPGVARVIHQADWISGQFLGRFDVTDENNALKTGYDAVTRRWPNWLAEAGMRPNLLPTVVPAGTITGRIERWRAVELGLSADVAIVAGTTDGCAAFLAAGAETCGHAVTSLGTTLVLKVLSNRAIFAPKFGVYSHRIGNGWLVGGASNSGGGAIAKHFRLDRVRELSKRMDPKVASGLDYYPLAGRGERFPICDPRLEARLEPGVDNDVLFLQALMEGVTGIEKLGYRVIANLGGPSVTSTRTVGAAARNPAWRTIRERILGVPLVEAADNEAAVGVAKLAQKGLGVGSPNEVGSLNKGKGCA
ncbi:MAG: FGGY-family carbohydrate kinase [Xanthobacteraceae bacterium]